VIQGYLIPARGNDPDFLILSISRGARGGRDIAWPCYNFEQRTSRG
jgi:hypothetical protein